MISFALAHARNASALSTKAACPIDGEEHSLLPPLRLVSLILIILADLQRRISKQGIVGDLANGNPRRRFAAVEYDGVVFLYVVENVRSRRFRRRKINSDVRVTVPLRFPYRDGTRLVPFDFVIRFNDEIVPRRICYTVVSTSWLLPTGTFAFFASVEAVASAADGGGGERKIEARVEH